MDSTTPTLTEPQTTDYDFESTSSSFTLTGPQTTDSDYDSDLVNPNTTVTLDSTTPTPTEPQTTTITPTLDSTTPDLLRKICQSGT